MEMQMDGPGMFGNRTFSQHGEDLVLACIFERLGIERPSYIDCGAFHPVEISNTALFYDRGSRGINVDADPDMIGLFEELRPEDKNLNFGILPQRGPARFYRSTETRGCNSFVRSHLESFAPVTDEIEVEAITMMQIVDEYAGGQFPDLLNLDVEGLDLEILESLDWKRTAPKVVCVEAMEHGARRPIWQHLAREGYEFIFRCVHNDIYVKRFLWEKLDLPR
jgi:FkbM family methyltransferase